MNNKNENGEKKFSDELDELIRDTQHQFNKFKQKKNRRWVFFIPLLIPLFSPALWILGIICLIIYFACDSKKDQ